MSDEAAFNAAVNRAEALRQSAFAEASGRLATTPANAVSYGIAYRRADVAYFQAVVAAGVAYGFLTPSATDALKTFKTPQLTTEAGISLGFTE